MENARVTVSRLCGGIDDMHKLGNKALVIRAEIYPERLPKLHEALSAVHIDINPDTLPDQNQLTANIEYSLTIQIISYSDDTDAPINIPQVPG